MPSGIESRPAATRSWIAASRGWRVGSAAATVRAYCPIAVAHGVCRGSSAASAGSASSSSTRASPLHGGDPSSNSACASVRPGRAGSTRIWSSVTATTSGTGKPASLSSSCRRTVGRHGVVLQHLEEDRPGPVGTGDVGPQDGPSTRAVADELQAHLSRCHRPPEHQVLAEQLGDSVGERGSDQAGKVRVPRIQPGRHLPVAGGEDHRIGIGAGRATDPRAHPEQLGPHAERPLHLGAVRRRRLQTRLRIHAVDLPGAQHTAAVGDGGGQQLTDARRRQQRPARRVVLHPHPATLTGLGVVWQHCPVHIALSLLAIAAAVVAVTAIAERVRFSAPLLLMLVGIGASFVPFIHEPSLNTDIVLIGFLPPLLYATAIRSSIIDFRTNVDRSPTCRSCSSS